MGVRAREGGAGGGTALPNSGKTVGGNWGKQDIGTCVFICVKFRANQPLCPP